jgi:hypothetical protein
VLRDGLDRAEERGLLVERLAGVAHEHGRDAQRGLRAGAVEERRARRVPRGVAAGLVRVADAAVRERGGVGFALDEDLALELGNRLVAEGKNYFAKNLGTAAAN